MATSRQLPARLLLSFAAVAIGFAAADTYVVVLALPDMMTSASLTVEELQQAAPIISGFLLGYVAVLPIIGRIADLRGRVPVLVGCVLVFMLGSLITAAAYNLTTIVLGRLIQGVGGGGLIPPTLALIADLWPPKRRGLPLGIVGAVQELGSVLGPLYGAVVLALGDWRDIFWLNSAVGAVLVAGLWACRDPDRRHTDARGKRAGLDWLSALLASLAIIAMLLVMLEPASLATGLTTGLVFVPITGESRWLSGLSLTAMVLVVLLFVRLATAERPLLDWRSWRALSAQTDPLGAIFLTLALSTVILTFASADPERATISARAAWLLLFGLVAFAGFWWRQRGATFPLIPRGTLSTRPAAGAVWISFLIGAALIAAIVDIPFFARLTIYRDSQLDAALVLLRFLVALPIGAVVGGWLLKFTDRSGWITAVAMTVSAAAFWRMSNWHSGALLDPAESIALLAAGLGFGVAIAPVNAMLLGNTPSAAHGVASALLIVARTVGMLVGISALTTLGMRAFYAETARIGTVEQLCGGESSLCGAYRQAVLEAGLAQLHVVFAGAAVICVTTAVSAVVVDTKARRGAATVKP